MNYQPNRTIGHLLMQSCRSRAKNADRIMERCKLFRGQGILLLTIAKQPGLTHSKIAEELDISAAAATKAIKRLEKAGYLHRQADMQDERISRVFLREEGVALIEQIKRAFKKLDAITFCGFSDEELMVFQGYLERILANLDENPSG